MYLKVTLGMVYWQHTCFDGGGCWFESGLWGYFCIIFIILYFYYFIFLLFSILYNYILYNNILYNNILFNNLYLLFSIFILFIFIIFWNLKFTIRANSTYYDYPPRGRDTYILAFNFGVVGSSPPLRNIKFM